MPTVIIPPTDVSPYTGTGDQVLATNPVFPSNITVSGTTDSSSKDTGAIVTEGGLGVEKSASIGGNLTVSGTGTSSFAGPVTGTSSTNGYQWTLTGSGIGGPSIALDATNATVANRYSGLTLYSGGTFQWGLQLRAGDGKFHIYDGVRGADALTVDVGPSSGVAGTTTVGGNLTVSGGTIGTAASTNLTLNGGSSGASLALGQGTTGTFTFTLPSISAGNTTWVSAGAVGVGVDFKRATAAATLGVTLASLNGYNGATRAAIFEFNGDGATDSGRFDWWVKPTAGSLTQAMVLKSNGNLLIGTTTDAASGARLQAQLTGTDGTVSTLLSLRKNTNAIGTGVAIDFTPDSTDNPLAKLSAVRTSLVFGYTDFRFSTWNGSTLVEQLRLVGQTGNLIIGSPFTDGGQKLQVNGTGLFSTTEPVVTLASTAVGNIAYQLISGGGSGHALGAFKIYDSSTGYVVLNHDKPTSGGTRLSFDGSGNATFAGRVVSNGTGFGVGANSDANTPLYALASVNGTFAGLIRNTNAGSSAFAGINIEADSGQAGFRQYSTAHSVWAGKTLISAPSGGTGLVLLTNGTGDAIDFWTNATQALSIDASQNIVPGTAALATTATNGFIYLQTCAGAPTGVPTSYTGRVASIYDTTNNKLYIYNGGWKSVTLA